MKLAGRASWLVLVGVGVGLLANAGCSDVPECGESGKLCGSGASGSGGASGGNGGTGGSEGGQGGSGGGPIPGCEDSPAENPQVISDSCAVFVSAAADAGGDGTKGKPFRTIGEALGAAGSKRVLVCGAQTFDESVAVESAELWGGFLCEDGWSYQGSTEDKRSVLAPGDAGSIPLTVTGTSTVAGFKVVAPAGADEGQSSIAAVVGETGNVGILDTELSALEGASGVAGEAPSLAEAKASPGSEGGNACSEAGQVDGGASAPNAMCSTSIGGNGGNGLVGAGAPGTLGAPAGANNGGAGDVGAGCDDGTKGDNGQEGDAGSAGASVGNLSLSGYTGAPGGEGGLGAVAQGGGGGGGAKGGLICSGGTVSGPGASGGSGGPGGCGGVGGKGGGAGGSSIALVSLGAAVSLTNVRLSAADGGDGGAGALGQGGQPGGDGADGGDATGGIDGPGCRGGNGGKGGNGGRGGGGRGGHSLGIATIGEAPTMTEVTFSTATTAAPGGDGGNAGAEGVFGNCWSFGADAACE